MQRPATLQLRSSLFREAVRIVESEYASDLSLDDVAVRVATSRRQLQRAYAEAGGTTFRTHLAHVRMERAARMLAGGVTVREASQRVGYRQPAQFAKAFRRHLGRHALGATGDRGRRWPAGPFARGLTGSPGYRMPPVMSGPRRHRA